MLGLRRLNNGEWNKPPALTLATAILMRRLFALFSRSYLKDVAIIHNGQGLSEANRDGSGSHAVYAAGGRVGNHSDSLSNEPFVVVGRKGSAGKCTYAPDGGWVIDTAYYAQPKDRDLSCKFLYYALSACDFTDDIIATAIPGINRTAIYEHEIPIPPNEMQSACVAFLDALASGNPPSCLPAPLAEQRRIVAKVLELVAKIEAARGLNSQCRAASSPLLSSSLGEHFRCLASRHTLQPLKLLASRITDGPHKTPIYHDDGIPFVTVQNMVSGSLSFTNLKYVSVEDHEEICRRCKPEQGDVLYSKDGATRGHPCYVDTQRPFNIFVSVALIKPLRDKLDGRYLCYVLKSSWIRDRMQERSRGDMIPHIVLGEIAQFPIPLPPLPEQRRIVAYLDDLQAKIDALKSQQAQAAAELDALLPSILDKAFKGEL